MRATTVCRLKLDALPVVAPITLVINIVIAVAVGVLKMIEVFTNFCANDIHDIYWHIYRPARYGHVADYPEETS